MKEYKRKTIKPEKIVHYERRFDSYNEFIGNPNMTYELMEEGLTMTNQVCECGKSGIGYDFGLQEKFCPHE